MCKILRRFIFPILHYIIPFVSISAFWLGSKFISPATPLPQLIILLALMAYGLALPMLIVRYEPSISRDLLIGDALIFHYAYGMQYLEFRTSAKTVIVGMIFAIVASASQYTGVTLRYVVFPLLLVSLLLELIVMACYLYARWRIAHHDGLLTVRRFDHLTKTYYYEGWPVAEARRDLSVCKDGYASTFEESAAVIARYFF